MCTRIFYVTLWRLIEIKILDSQGCVITCFDFLCHLFISLLLSYPSLFFFFFFPSPLLFPVSYLFFLFIYIMCVLLLCHHLLTSFLSLYQAAVTISILLICFCSFELCCPLLVKNSFIENLYIVLFCLVK